MFTKRTIIGIIIGAAIISIGIAAFISSLDLRTHSGEETIEIGMSSAYTITAPASTPQYMNITGDQFDLILESPGDGLQIPLTSYKDQLALDWTHLKDGTTHIRIQNTGNVELVASYMLKTSDDPIFFAYHLVVITSGIVIIGFSLRFSMIKPKGF